MSSWLIPLDIGIVQGLIFAPAAIGFAVALRLMKFPDLTVEASVMLGGASFAMARTNGLENVWALIIAALVGAGAGFLTAAAHCWLHVNKFLAGILVIAVAYTLGLRLMKGSNVSLIGINGPLDRLDSLDQLGPKGTHIGVVLALCGLSVLLVTLLAMLLRSPFGMRLRAIGSNASHSRAIGINVSLYTVVGLAGLNSLSGISGALSASYQGFGDIGMGQGTLILVLAGLAIGERCVPSTRLSSRVVVLLAAVIGVVLYQIALAVAVRAGLPATDLRAATALIVLVFVVRMHQNSDLLKELA